MKSIRVAGLFLIAAGHLALALPNPSDNTDGMRSDNYSNYDEEYPDDQSASSNQTKTPAADSIAATTRPYFLQPKITVTGVVGKNITLECNAKNLANSSVIMWYKGEQLLTNDHHILNPEYGLDKSNNALLITNASTTTQGDYICEVLPQHVRLHTTLVIADHPIETIVPESSISSQGCCHFHQSAPLVVALLFAISLHSRT